MTKDAFASPKRRLARAKEKIDDLEGQLAAWGGSNPYIRAVERNAQRFEEHKVKLEKPIPDAVTDLAYEAIEGMRSSLDQATYAVAVACGAKRTDLIHFPVADTASDFENVLNGRIRDFPADMLALFRAFKPYKAGNELIWALNRIRRQGTHRLIVPVCTQSAGGIAHLVTVSSPNFCELPRLVWNSEKDEMIFAITNPGSNLDYKLDLSFFVAFGEVEGIADEPVIETLRDMMTEATNTVTAIEAAAKRIGLI